MGSTTKDGLVNQISSFISEIGIDIQFLSLDEETFLPGIKIENGKLIVDREKLEYPGDLIHEAGHIALEPAEERTELNGNAEENKSSFQSVEIGVILWSWAALIYLKLDPKVVFHEAGYKGASEWYIDNFSSGNYLGLPLLQWMGLCKHDDEKDGTVPEFPHMIKWLRY